MEREEIFALTERLQQICPPECKVEIAPTKQRGEVYLVVIQFPSTATDLPVKPVTKMDLNEVRLQASFKRDPILKTAYNWERQKIHNFHYEIILPLIEKAEHFRVLYCSGGKFVFYTHVFGCMSECVNVFNYVGMNDLDNRFKYIGNCRNVDWLIGHLMTTFKEF